MTFCVAALIIEVSLAEGVMQKRWQYLAIEFLAHGVVAAIICVAPNYLAPYFSAARVCKALICALCLSAFLAGRTVGFLGAKKPFQPSRPFVFYGACALYLAAATFLGKYLSAGVAILYTALFSSGVMLACSGIMAAILFGVPLFMLGKASPYLVYMEKGENGDSFSAPHSGEERPSSQKGNAPKAFGAWLVLVGGAGIAVGAASSILLANKTPASLLMGAAVTAFLLYAIPLLLQGAHKLRQCVAFVLVFVCMAGSSSIPYCFINDEFLVKEYHSSHGYYKVEERSGETTLSRFAIEGATLKRKKGAKISASYTSRALAAYFMAEGIASDAQGGDFTAQGADFTQGINALCLGVGVGSFAEESAQIGATVTLVEKDKRALTLIKKHFGLPQTVTAVAGDGRAHLAKTSALYDVIFVDEYQSLALPQGVTGKEFFRLCAQKITQNGVVCLFLPQAESRYTNGVIAALCTAFPAVYTAKEGEGVLVFGGNVGLAERLYGALWQAEEVGTLSFCGAAVNDAISDAVLTALWDVYGLLTPANPCAQPFTDADARSLALEYARMEEMVAPTYKAYRKKLKTSGFWNLFSE